ncbi:phosphatidylserine decarboxylase [Exophiala sideris]|uniref:Phosphatidylserine decarboxylase n=1 Tax=Exophiala sideris TaxID=1016849 RepID=A0A0D1YEA3_9EURO|nr:phosphatidylserine decarboxylase [Exophiala sideris]
MADEAQHEANINASATALDSLTTAAADHPIPPLEHIHAGADEKKSHAWLKKILPDSVLDDYENRYHFGNYVIDRKTGQKSYEEMSVYVRLGMHFLYYGSKQEKLLHAKKVEKLLEEQSVKMGKQYDSPESKAHIKPFLDSFQLWDSMKEMVKPNPEDYANFNEFFSREIRPEARPPAEPNNNLVTSSPADCRLTAFPTIDLATKYWIKGTGFTLERLFNDAKVAQYFDGGSIAIARLAPQDYHRWHSPITGTVIGVKKIPGAYYTVNPQAINEPGTLTVFCENRRDVMLMRSAATGNQVAVIAVGAMLVGSIKWNPGMETPGTEIRRGQCQGAFQYGGSTVLVVYPKGEVVLDEDLVRNSCEQNCETLVQVGWRVGAKQ